MHGELGEGGKLPFTKNIPRVNRFQPNSFPDLSLLTKCQAMGNEA
jgi:hypothetical protein